MGKKGAEVFLVRLVRVKTSRKGYPVSFSYRITVPKRVVEAMKLKKGDFLRVAIEKVKLR